MSLLKQIDDKGAVLEWCPVPSFPNLVALGTKDSAGGGFDDSGGDLEIHILDFADTSLETSRLLGKVHAGSRFASIAWSKMSQNPEEFPYGIIAGGMVDGNIKVWDVARLIARGEGADVAEDDCLIASILQHQGTVCGLQFNPHLDMSYLLASGGADGEVYIISLERPEAPNVFSPAPPPNTIHHTADVTKLAWNSQVAHILASCAQNGSCIVWDLKGKKAWCELKEPLGGSFTDIAWNPDQGLNLVTASGDDKNPVIKLWDLRSSTSLPLATLSAHTQGILSVSWCPTDSSLLLSCGKDNKTFLWDLYQLQPIYELPTVNSGDENNDGFNRGDFGGSLAGQRRNHIAWSSCLPAVVSACSFDRRIQFFSVSGYKSKNGRAPKWLRRPVGACFGFGGKLVSFNNSTVLPQVTDPQQQQQRSRQQQRAGIRAEVVQVVEDPALVNACDNFHTALDAGDFKAFCEMKVYHAETFHEQQVWGLMKVVCFETEARQELLKYLGFDNNDIAAIGQQFLLDSGCGNDAAVVSPPPPAEMSPAIADMTNNFGGMGVSAEDVFGGAPDIGQSLNSTASAEDVFGASVEQPPVAAEDVFGAPPETTPVPDAEVVTETTDFTGPDGASTSNEPVVEETVPPPPAAVSPVLPAPIVDPEVAALATEMATSVVASKNAEPVIRNALITGNFELAVDCCMQCGLYAEALCLAQCAGADLWHHTQQRYFSLMIEKLDRPMLRILQAVTKSELLAFVEQSHLVSWKETLAVLSTYAKTEEFPSLCVVLAERLERESGDVDSATLCYMCAARVPQVVSAWVEELKMANAAVGHMSTKALQQFVEKVVIFTKANNEDNLGEECVAYFAEYASLLASQGRLDVAAKYLYGDNVVENILRDRLYQSTPNKPAGQKAPAFPFTKVLVAAPGATNSSKAATSRAGAATVTQNAQSNIQQNSAKANSAAQQQTPQRAPEPVQAAAPALPSGWIQLQDPSSGRAYYVNQATGVSQWESPVPEQPAAQQSPQPVAQKQSTGFGQPATNTGGYGQQAGGYGQQAGGYGQQAGGYGQLAGGYGQQSSVVTQFNPAAPAKAASPALSSSSKTKETTPAEPEVDTSVIAPVVQELTNIVTMIAEVCTPSEKRQIAMVLACIQVLNTKIARDEVASDVMGKVEQLTYALGSRNYPAASFIQTDLANTVWTQHKEWLKGLKVIIQLASKK